MKELNVVAKTKKGEMKEGTVLVPESLSEMIAIVGEKETYEGALERYMRRAKRDLCRTGKPRRKLLKIDLGGLSEHQRAALQSAGLL